MFTLKTKSTEPNQLDELINKVYARMSMTEPDALEFATMADQLTKLYKLKETETSKKRVSPDALAAIGGNLAGILLLISYERVHVITSKAVGFVTKSVR